VFFDFLKTGVTMRKAMEFLEASFRPVETFVRALLVLSIFFAPVLAGLLVGWQLMEHPIPPHEILLLFLVFGFLLAGLGWASDLSACAMWCGPPISFFGFTVFANDPGMGLGLLAGAAVLIANALSFVSLVLRDEYHEAARHRRQFG